MPESIEVYGAREHNLKNVHVVIPRDKLVVFTGLSGSGKSSLAFDTIFAEGQRRYVESLSSYARQFLGLMEKPDVDFIDGLSPAISIDQKATSKNPRSTVATVTEIYDYLRLFYARIGIPHCPQCGREVRRQTLQEIVDRVEGIFGGSRVMIGAPVVRGRKGEYREVFDELVRQGFARVLVDGVIYELSNRSDIKLKRYEAHTISVIVDRIVVTPEDTRRLTESVETALARGDGLVEIIVLDENRDIETTETFSEALSCPVCGISVPILEPRSFSFNSPFGACPACSGLGLRFEVDEDLVLPYPERSLLGGAVAPFTSLRADFVQHMLERVAREYDIPLTVPVRSLSPQARQIVLYGVPEKIEQRYRDRRGQERSYSFTYEGAVNFVKRRHLEVETESTRDTLEAFMRQVICDECGGTRLRPEARSVTVCGHSIDQITSLSIGEALKVIEEFSLTTREESIVRQVRKEILARIRFLVDVGLSYLTLARSSGSLSGGEAQRIRLASQIGSGLAGVLYVLDEPSIGLHQRDNGRLITTLLKLRDLGNTVIVVEHDEETIRAADYVVDIGPFAGVHGGEVIYAGDVEGLTRHPASLTGAYLSRRESIAVPAKRKKPRMGKIVVKGAREHNLKNLTVGIPLGVFTCVTGVAGSGKSTLVNEILYKSLRRQIHGSHDVPGLHDAIAGVELIDKVIDIDQAPIGRTPRSNPATYTKMFDQIRILFSQTAESRARGYKPGRFSFNVKGGRCETCAGEGTLRIEMNFLPDVYVECEACKGTRYNRDTLEIKYRDLSIADVLNLSVSDALKVFSKLPAVARHLETLHGVGLGYLRLGQAATTLSGGEAQRVKLAAELARKATGKTLYILDEPTTGLHFEDVKRLLEVLHALVEQGNTVVVIEHNLDVIKTADWIVDLGPDGGDAGGKVLGVGTPEHIAAIAESYTGQYLGAALK